MSSHGQTYALEAFHSVLINFAPKSQAFSPAGMLASTRLAILHYNKTSDRCQAVTQQGDPCFTVTTSKARKGHATAREKKTDPTYEYVRKLVQEVMASNEQCTSLDEAAITKKCIFPAPMNAAFTRPSKRELVEARRSRFGRVTPTPASAKRALEGMVNTSKARKGHATAREKKTDPTYEYVRKPVQEAMASNEQCTSPDEAAIAKKHIFPAPMNAAFTRPSWRQGGPGSARLPREGPPQIPPVTHGLNGHLPWPSEHARKG